MWQKMSDWFWYFYYKSICESVSMNSIGKGSLESIILVVKFDVSSHQNWQRKLDFCMTHLGRKRLMKNQKNVIKTLNSKLK